MLAGADGAAEHVAEDEQEHGPPDGADQRGSENWSVRRANDSTPVTAPGSDDGGAEQRRPGGWAMAAHAEVPVR